MSPVVGVFKSKAAAAEGLRRLDRVGINPEHINILTPASTDEDVAAVPVSETEQPGMASAVGALVGGALGAAGGLGAGAAVASFLVPGVGPILAGGLLGAGLLGLGGAAGGAAAGEAAEEAVPGLPRDEIYVYEDALRRGRTVIVVQAEDGTATDAARQALVEAGAESIDAAREEWWIGLRSSEQERYIAEGGDFGGDEASFRKGFEAAQALDVRDKSYDEALHILRSRHPEAASEPCFQKGFQRGRQYRDQLSFLEDLSRK